MNERITKARIALLIEEPFFGSLLMHLKPVESRAVKTFSTDGRTLFYNPEFLDTLSDAELRSVLAHEVLHPALLHPFRMGQRNVRKFNIAADYAINNFLDSYNQSAVAKGETPPFPLPKDVCVDHQYDGLSAEEIYDRMIDPPPDNGGNQKPQSQPNLPSPGRTAGQGQPQPGQGNGQSDPSDQSDSPSSIGEFTAGPADKAEAEAAEAEWKIAVQQAALAGKGRGNLPAEIERMVNELLNPAVSWREILRTFLTSVATDDYSWMRPNRRYLSSGLILPGMHSPRLGPVIVAIDTSGSIDQRQFDSFMAEARSILFDCRPEKFILAQCDAAIAAWDELDPFGDIDVAFKGGGGTDFCPVFERALNEPEPPAALIYLTDLQGSFPDGEPPFPVLWASTTKSTAPFGTTINL